MNGCEQLQEKGNVVQGKERKGNKETTHTAAVDCDPSIIIRLPAATASGMSCSFKRFPLHTDTTQGTGTYTEGITACKSCITESHTLGAKHTVQGA